MSGLCRVKICKNNYRKTKGNSIHYFRFPKNEMFKEKWTQATGFTVISVKNPRICSIHFSEDCYVDDWMQKTYNLPSHSKRLLKHDAIPTLHLQEESSCSIKKEARQGDDSTGSNSKELNNQIEETQDSQPVVMENNDAEESGRSIQNTQTSAVKAKFRKTARKCIRKKRDCEMTKKFLKRNVQLRLKMRSTEVRYKIQMEVKQKQLEAMTERCQKEEAEKMELRNALQRCEEKLAELEEDRIQCNKATVSVQKLSRMFTPGQIKMIMDPKLTKVHWSDEDYDAAMSALSHGHAAYEYWRCIRKVPMPAPSTLRK